MCEWLPPVVRHRDAHGSFAHRLTVDQGQQSVGLVHFK